MKAAKRQSGWEPLLTRYFAAVRIPLRWDARAKRFVGLAGHAVARINPIAEEGWWTRAPEFLRRYEAKEPHKKVVLIVASRRYGDNIEDAIVVMRVGAFAPMVKALVEGDRERWEARATPDQR